MALGQGIRDFYSAAADRDFTRNHNLRVDSIRTADAGVDFESPDLVYIETANLPARSITNIPTPYMGIDFNVPGLAKYPGSDAYDITFRADGDNRIRTLWEDWTYHIFDDRFSWGDYKLHRNAMLNLTLLDQMGNQLRRYSLHGVYPVTCGELVFDMKGNGDVVSFTATIAYQYWSNGPDIGPAA